jgi:hypothetical protein
MYIYANRFMHMYNMTCKRYSQSGNIVKVSKRSGFDSGELVSLQVPAQQLQNQHTYKHTYKRNGYALCMAQCEFICDLKLYIPSYTCMLACEMAADHGMHVVTMWSAIVMLCRKTTSDIYVWLLVTLTGSHHEYCAFTLHLD